MDDDEWRHHQIKGVSKVAKGLAELMPRLVVAASAVDTAKQLNPPRAMMTTLLFLFAPFSVVPFPKLFLQLDHDE